MDKMPQHHSPHFRQEAHFKADPVYEKDMPTNLDRWLHSLMGQCTMGISPASLALAYGDWAFHLLESPGKWQSLAGKAISNAARLIHYGFERQIDPGCKSCIEPLPQDKRFADPSWHGWPFNLIHQAFLLNQQWWHTATTGIGGLSAHHEHVVSFIARQWLDLFAPVNFIATNPVVLKTTISEGGLNLVRGYKNLIENTQRELLGRQDPLLQNFRPGHEVAVTSGKVVYRNRLMELIQYRATTQEVAAEPILIVPAWIMKYYILDLSPANSLVKYLVDHGHTVFMISWHNPTENDRDLGMEDYLQLGVLEAIHAVRNILPGSKINAVGYCLGGTLWSIAAAYLAQKDHGDLNSLTLLAAQTDFSEPGELSLFIDESQVDYLEDLMWMQGFLGTRQMSSAFQLLRSNDLIWSRIVSGYLLGKESHITDLMAWNADTTRMPYRMHSQYLRSLFLNNDFSQGRFSVNGVTLALNDINVPIFAVATETDHVSPWMSVYKIHLVAQNEVTFVLTSGGHNAGIVSEPGHPHRHFRLSRTKPKKRFIGPKQWLSVTPVIEGSWWPAWLEWLTSKSSGMVPAPGIPAAQTGLELLDEAPGSYVHER